jgi:hypothetical protein
MLVVLLTFTSGEARAADPCESLLCMAGKLQGQSGGDACSAPIGDYFAIMKFGRHGRFNPSKTAAARLNFLTSCAADGVGDWPMRINAAYGPLRSMGW